MTGSPLYDRDQLQPEDTLVDEPTGDVLDSGYEPPDSVRGHGLGKSVAEQAEGETIEQRLAQEEPEDPNLPGRPLSSDAVPDVDRVGGELADDGLDNSSLSADADAPVAGEVGPEEGAMHVVADAELPELELRDPDAPGAGPSDAQLREVERAGVEPTDAELRDAGRTAEQ